MKMFDKKQTIPQCGDRGKAMIQVGCLEYQSRVYFFGALTTSGLFKANKVGVVPVLKSLFFAFLPILIFLA